MNKTDRVNLFCSQLVMLRYLLKRKVLSMEEYELVRENIIAEYKDLLTFKP